MASRCPLTAGRVCIGILITALLPGPHFRSVATASTPSSDKPRSAQLATAAAVDSPVKVSGVTIQTGSAGETVVDVATSSPVTYRVLKLKNPQRLVVDLEGALKDTLRTSYSTKSPVLKRVRVGQFREESPPIVRVVADLKVDPAFDVLATPGGVRIELKRSELAPSPATAVVKPEVEKPVPAPLTAPAQQPAPQAPAAPGQTSPNPLSAPPVQAPPRPNLQVSPSAFYRRSPLKSLSQNEKLLDSLGLRIVLTFNYRKGGADEAAWKTKATPGVAAYRVFIRPVGPGAYRTIELAITPFPQGGFELVVYGQQVEQTAQGPNTDFPAIQQLVNDEVARMEQTPPIPDLLSLSYETYYLSYVVADRAVALLKTLGYTTVEFSGQAGESSYQSIFNPMKLGSGRPPIIVKLIDSSKTSLMEPAPSGVPGQPMAPQPAQPPGAGAGFSTTPAIGGTFLSQMTSGEPQERLLILYDKDDPESLQSLMNLLHTTVDVPSREIIIEALVIELNSNRTKELGITFESQQNRGTASSVITNPETGAIEPFLFTFDKSVTKLATFKAKLEALLTTGEAEILSNPSVLVLDDRQARIQIGQQVPITKSVSTAAGLISSVDYFPVGIVLNLRPRISEDGSEVTMQTETIVSAINRTVSALLPGTSVIVAPLVDNRQVQTFVRVADNTPFIIGGLISTDNRTTLNGIPLLSQIPGLGALFRRTTSTKVKQEVIIVVTPHVVPLEDKYFSYVIPKDSAQFDRFNYRLFRNAYRIRGNDLFDLEFVYDSNVYKQLVSRVNAASATEPQLRTAEPFATVLKGGAPGEDILVRRMLWEIIDKTHYARYINPDRIIFLENNPSAAGGSGFQLAFLNQKLKNLKHEQNGLALTFEALPQGTEERPFVFPKSVVSYPEVNAQSYPELLINGNRRNPDGTPGDWMILLSKNYSGIRVPPLELLREVLVLKRLIELNKSMPLTLKEFHIGRQIVFPSQEELQQANLFIDREVAKLFYEVYNYYPAFEQVFNRETRKMKAKLDAVIPPK